MEENMTDVILDKNYTNRNMLKMDLVKYMLGIWETGAVGIILNDSGEEKQTFVEDIAEAMIEDAEMSDYARCIWDEYTFDCESQNNNNCSWGCMNQDKSKFSSIDGMIDAVAAKITDQSSGLYNYTFWYPLPRKDEDSVEYIDIDEVKKVFHNILNDMNKQIDPELYHQAYPVFWLEAFNIQFSKVGKKQICFKQPIEIESDKEKYLFVLLFNNSTPLKGGTIFSAIQTGFNKTKKDKKNYLDMDNSGNRHLYVKIIRDSMSENIRKILNEKDKKFKEENKFGNQHNKGKKKRLKSIKVENATVLKNNIITLRELIRIGIENDLDGINKPVFIFLLERLTGWMGFYNYVRMGEGRKEDKRKWVFHESTLKVLKKLFSENKIKKQMKKDAIKTIRDLVESNDDQKKVNIIEQMQKNFQQQPDDDKIDVREELLEMLEYFKTNLDEDEWEKTEGETGECIEVEECMREEIEKMLPIIDWEQFFKAYKIAKHMETEASEKIVNYAIDSKLVDMEENFEEAYFKFMSRNHIATFYCISRWMEDNNVVSKLFKSYFVENFFSFIVECQDLVRDKINWGQKAGSKPESKWYDMLYDELFIDDIEKVHKATKFEAANFYDTWRN